MSSLNLKINGQTVDVSTEISPTLDLINPHLLYDMIPESNIKLPNLPFSPRNQKVFGYWEEPQTGGNVPEFLFEYVFGGELIHEGVFSLKEASQKNGYVGDTKEEFSRFFGDYQATLLTEIKEFGTLPLAVVNGVHSNSGTEAYCLPTIVNTAYYGDKGASIGYTNKVNDYVDGAYLLTNTPRVPFMFVKWILLKIAEITQTTITGSFLEHPDWSKLVLFNLRALDGANVVTVTQHLPELTVETFLLELRKLPNLKFSIDPVNKVFKIDFWEDDLVLPAITDWSDKGLIGEVKVPEPNPRLQLGYKLDAADALAKDKPAELADYVTPEYSNQYYTGIAKVTSEFSITLVNEATGLAEVRQEGVTSQFEQLTKKVSPKLLFWNGIVDGYPRALPTINGTSLYWNGTDGLRAKHWSVLESMRAGQFYLKKEILLNEVDLAKLDFTRKVFLNGVEYLVAQLSGELPITKAFSALLVGLAP